MPGFGEKQWIGGLRPGEALCRQNKNQGGNKGNGNPF
jgi:hypothetical protein